jgi:hypothetical protein
MIATAESTARAERSRLRIPFVVGQETDRREPRIASSRTDRRVRGDRENSREHRRVLPPWCIRDGVAAHSASRRIRDQEDDVGVAKSNRPIGGTVCKATVVWASSAATSQHHPGMWNIELFRMTIQSCGGGNDDRVSAEDHTRARPRRRSS